MYPWSLHANLFMGGQCTFAIDLCKCLFKAMHLKYNTLHVNSSSVWVSTALATFACKRKPLTVYLLKAFIKNVLIQRWPPDNKQPRAPSVVNAKGGHYSRWHYKRYWSWPTRAAMKCLEKGILVHRLDHEVQYTIQISSFGALTNVSFYASQVHHLLPVKSSSKEQQETVITNLERSLAYSQGNISTSNLITCIITDYWTEQYQQGDISLM